MSVDFERWKEQCWAEEVKVTPEPSTESETPLAFQIFTFGSLLFLYGCYFAFCWWLISGFHADMLEMEAGTADPKLLRGYGKLLEFLAVQFGVWPASLLIFGAMQIPVVVMCLQAWRPLPEDDVYGHVPATEPRTPRLEAHTAKKMLIVLAVFMRRRQEFCSTCCPRAFAPSFWRRRSFWPWWCMCRSADHEVRVSEYHRATDRT